MKDGVMIPDNFDNQAFAVEGISTGVLKLIMSKGMWTDERLTVRKLIQGKCDYNSKKVRVRG